MGCSTSETLQYEGRSARACSAPLRIRCTRWRHQTCCDSVRLRIGAARRRIFLHMFRLRIQTAEIAASVVGIPDDVVGIDGDPPWASLRTGEEVFRDLHRLWIDAADLAGGEQIE